MKALLLYQQVLGRSSLTVQIFNRVHPWLLPWLLVRIPLYLFTSILGSRIYKDPSWFAESKTTHSSGHFTFSDLEDDMPSRLVAMKKEKVPPSAPIKKTQLDLPMKPSSSRKRKYFDILDFESLWTNEALWKLISFSQFVTIFVFPLFKFDFLLIIAFYRWLVMSLILMSIPRQIWLK